MSNRGSATRGLLVVMVIGLMAGYTLGAQQSMNQQQTQQLQGQAEQALTLARTDKLIGKNVKDAQGQMVGKIRDIVLTPDLRQVAYIALESNRKYYAVPWSALHQGPGETYTLSISKQDLTKAQAFSKDNWPAQANMQLLSQSQGATASSQQGAETSQQGMAQEQQSSSQTQNVEQRRVTKLKGMQVKSKEGDDIGKIEGFVIDLGGESSSQTGSRQANTEPNQMSDENQAGGSQQRRDPSQAGQQVHSGSLVFTVLSFGGTWGMGKKYSLVPSNLVDIRPAQKTATLNATKQTVESLAFSRNKFPDLSNRQYVRQVYQTFGEQPYWPALGYVPPEQQPQGGQQSRQGQTGQSQTDQSGAQSRSNQ